MNDRDFLHALESCTLPPTEFDHRAHVRAAYLYSADADFATSLARVEGTIRTFAASLGKPDKYHETITVAFLALVRRRMWEGGPFEDWQAFARANPDILDSTLLKRLYPADVLASSVARRTFILPLDDGGSCHP